MKRRPSASSANLKLSTIPLLVLLCLAGMPLGQSPASREAKYSEQLSDEIFQRAGEVGIENTWLAAAIFGAIYLIALIATIRERHRSDKLIRNYWPLFGLIISTVICLFWSIFPQPIMMNLVHLVGTAFVAFAAGRYHSGNLSILLKYISCALGLNVLVHILVIFILPDIAINYDGRWAGLTPNPNSLGLIAALAVWSIVTALSMKTLRPDIALALLVPSAMALYGSGSITSTICAILGVGSAAIFATVREVGIGLATLMVTTFLVGISLLLWSDINVANVTSIFGRTDDFTGRDVIWRQGVEMISMRPILGWGYDNHASIMQFNPLIYGHFHNGYIDLAVRGGFIAIMLFLGLIFSYIRRALCETIKAKSIAMSFLIMFVIYNLTEVSILSPRDISWVLLIVWMFSMKK